MRVIKNVTPTGYQNGEEGLANQTTGNTTTSWTRDPAGTLISQRTGTTHAYYLTDALGSVLALVDTTGTIGASYTYDPYGITTTSGSLASSNPWRYTSGYQDPTGLYHLNARYYDPSLGRFTQLDPSGVSTGYAYAAADPIDNSDPTGLFCILGRSNGRCRGAAQAGRVVADTGNAVGFASSFAPGPVGLIAGGVGAGLSSAGDYLQFNNSSRARNVLEQNLVVNGVGAVLGPAARSGIYGTAVGINNDNAPPAY